MPPVPVGRIFGAFVYIAGDMLWPDSFFQSLILPVAGELAIVLTGFAVMMVALAQHERPFPPGQFTLIGVPALLILAFVVWLIQSWVCWVCGGAARHGRCPYPCPGKSRSTWSLYRANPQLWQRRGRPSPRIWCGRQPHHPGRRRVTHLQRLCQPVNAYFHWYWGFDFSQLPLNGLVWYPEGAGPPLKGHSPSSSSSTATTP
jgi:hypothetical protein